MFLKATLNLGIWENEAGRIMRAELSRRGFTYRHLAKRLQTMGVVATQSSLASKVSRGTFSFAFFL